jgi:uncharacterized oxidoreductase
MSIADEPVLVRSEALGELSCALLERAGAPAGRARVVVDHLLESDAIGLPSHGIIRMPQYLDEIARGEIRPDASISIDRPVVSRLVVDGGDCFGQVVGHAMVDALGPVALETGIAFATGRHMGHTGRIGAYPAALAQRGMVAIAVCSGPRSGHRVAPFGGREGRLATNPIAFAYPVAGEPAVVADFSTAATAEGVIRNLRNRGLQAPEGALRDATGRPTTDPNALYVDPPGTIQPLGGPLGYRGTALGILVEVLGTLLASDDTVDETRTGSNLALLAIAPQPGFADLAQRLGAYVRSAPAIRPEMPVLMPGDRERAAALASAPVSVDGRTWRDLVVRATAAGIPMPPYSPSGA